MTLADLSVNEEAVIDCLDIDDELYHARVNGMGFRCGFKVRILRKAPFNGPIHVIVSSTEFVVRRCDAENIIVRKE